MDEYMNDDNDMNKDEEDIINANIENKEEKQQMKKKSRLNK